MTERARILGVLLATAWLWDAGGERVARAQPGGAPAQLAERVPRVGLVVATRINVTAAEAQALSARLGEVMREDLRVDVVAGADAGRRLPPAGVADDCVARPDCVRDLASRLGADELVFLVMIRIGPRLQIDATWADPATGDAVSRPALVLDEDGPAPETVLARAPRQILPHATARSTAPLVLGGDPGGVGDARSGRRSTPVVIATGAISGVALVTGVGLAVSARRDFNSLERDGCDLRACPDEDLRIDRMERKALAADLLFITAAAAGVTSVVLYLRSGRAEPPIQVGADGSGAYVSFGGKF
jgi:hypothetical protein